MGGPSSGDSPRRSNARVLVRLGAAAGLLAAPPSAQLVTFGSRRFHHVLKAKFGLNDR